MEENRYLKLGIIHIRLKLPHYLRWTKKPPSSVGTEKLKNTVW